MIQSNKFRVKERSAVRLLFMLTLFLTGFSGTALADDTTTLTKDTDGYYLITSGEDLEEFANIVNKDTATVNARLTADIDITPAENTSWTPIGKFMSCPFKGKFDGQGHTISGLAFRVASYYGLFGYVNGATIENLTLLQPTYTTYNPDTQYDQFPLGAVCGGAVNTVFRNCHVKQAALNFADFSSAKTASYIGGIVGSAENGTKIIGCSFDGYLTSASTKWGLVGGIVGYLSLSDIDSCSVTNHSAGTTVISGSKYVGGICGACYYRSVAAAIHNCTVEDGVEVNSTDTTTVGTIYGAELVSTESLPGLYDGAYEIYNAGQLAAFRDVISSDHTANARLMNDIDMADAGEFSPIASSSSGYLGTFDGQGYTISNLTLKNQAYAGLFSWVCSNGDVHGTVKNLNLKSPKLRGTDYNEQGFISGHVAGKGVIENCNVTDGYYDRSAAGTPECIGGIAGKADTGATINLCSFQGTVKDVEEKVGGIVGNLYSGASVTNCYLYGPSYVHADDYAGGIVGFISENDCTVKNCYVTQSTGTVEVSVSKGNTSNLISGKTVSNDVYTEDYLKYERSGRKNGRVEMTVVTGVEDQTKTSYHVINNIGTMNYYATDSIAYLPGVKELDFIDCNSNIAGTKADFWIDMTIADEAFDANFEKLYMRYKVYAGADHTVSLRPGDVKPAGKNMFLLCPKAKVYVDAEYYDSFCADPMWSNYKDNLVAVTDFRETDFTEEGVKYAYDRNADATASVLKKTGKTGSDVTMVHVIGCDDSKISDNDGVLKIYQDIGETYNYNTTKVWAKAFKGNTTIKHVKFEEIMADARDSYYDLNIALGDSAFANCTNLEYFDLVLSSDKDNDHYTVIHPSEMPIGNHVFDGCSKLKIRIPTAVYDEYLANDDWNQYASHFEKTDFGVSKFNEKGVKYAYYVSGDGKTLYTNKNTEEMEDIVTPWMGMFRNFKFSSVLVPDNSNTIYYLMASEVDNDDIDDEDGVMRIYNDIGTTYNYKTIALSSTGFRNNEHIKKIVFEDCASYSENANTDLALVIPDGTFMGCKNLKELSMYYLVTEGDNHYEAIKPSQIFIGENVFEGVDSTFRIKVLPDLYQDYITDANWSQYKDIIEASDYLPTTEDPFERDGVTYDFISNSLNSIATSTTIREDASLINIPIIIAEAASVAYTAYSVYKSAANTAANAIAEAEKQVAQKGEMMLEKTLEENRLLLDGTRRIILENGPDELVLRVYKKGITKAMEKVDEAILSLREKLVTPVIAQYKTASTVLNSAVKFAGTASAKLVAEFGTGYILSRAQKNFSDNWSWHINSANWVTVTKRYNVPKLFIKEVSDDATDITIYADPSNSTTRYSTSVISPKAFRNKKNLKSIKFQDEPTGNLLPYEPLMISLPDSCFAGCDNLQELNLILTSKYGNSRKKALTPDNFVLTGDPFAGCDSTMLKNFHIVVGSDVYNEFVSDSYWSKYADYYKKEDVSQKKDQSEWSCLYTKHYNLNSIPEVTQVDSHDIEHVDIYGADNTGLHDNNGLAALINDYGIYNNYKLDNVLKKAFYNNWSLLQVDITDSHTFCGDVYTDFNVYLQDSCFADCKYLKDFNLIYQVTDGTNKTQSITPEQVSLGEGVFDGCDSLRLKVCIDQEANFLADAKWAKYKDKIFPSFFDPVDDKVFNLLKDDIMFKTALNDNEWEHLDATRATPKMLRTRFKGTDIEMFDEFRAFSSCGLDTIFQEMFKDCQALQSITLPRTTKYIGKYAFQGCTNLASFTIPESVTGIDGYVFQNSGIKTIICSAEKPATVENGGNWAFMGLPDDYVIYVPDSLVDIYKKEWYSARDHINAQSKRGGSLKVITVTEVGQLASKLGLVWDYSEDYDYNKCRVALKGNYAQYDSLRIIGPLDARDLGVLRMMAGRNTMCEVNPAGNLQYLDLYDAQFKKGDYMYDMTETFENNSRIDLDDDVSGYLFYKLDKLKTLILPKTSKVIRHYAFANCANLETIVVGDNVTEVCRKAVNESANLKTLVMLPEKMPDTSSSAWDINSSDARFEAIIASNDGASLYDGDANYNAYADTVYCMFKDKALFSAMKRNHVFCPQDLYNVSDITGFMNGNDTIQTFNELYYTSVESLGNGTLTDMSNLQEVTLPVALDTITVDAFKGCSSLEKINAFNVECPGLAQGAFASLPQDFVIEVQEGDEDKYREAWPEYADHIKSYRAARTQVREIVLTKMNTLADSLGLTVESHEKRWGGQHLIDKVTGKMSDITALKVSGPIGSQDVAVLRMLAGCTPNNNIAYTSNLSYLDLYDAEIKKDEDWSFLKYYVYSEPPLLRDKESAIEEDNVAPVRMFYNCNNLKTIIMPRTATKLDDYALNTMASLETIVVGDNVTSIEDKAFGDASNLKTIIFLGGAAETASDFFDDNIEGDCNKVDNMYVPKSEKENFTKDAAYTKHTNKISSPYDDVYLFRALGCKGIVTEDDLSTVDDIDGWFDRFTGITDLSPLKNTVITELKASNVDDLSQLQYIALPSTLTKIENYAFYYNPWLRWADLSACENLNADIDKLSFTRLALVYVPESFGTQTADNVVYGASNALKCAKFVLTDTHDYDVPKAFTADAVTFERTFPDSISALTLPFSCTVPDGFRAYQLETAASEYNEARFQEVETMNANEPYVIKRTASDAEFTVNDETEVEAKGAVMTWLRGVGYTSTGTLSAISAAEARDAKMLVVDTNGVWNLLSEDATEGINQFSAYLQVTNTSASTKDVPSYFDNIDLYELTLDEGQDNSSEISNHVNERVNANLTRTLVAGAWNTFCVPFKTYVEGSPLEGSAVSGVKEINDNVITYQTVRYLLPGKAYLVKPAKNIVNPTFKGVKISSEVPTYNNAYDFVGTYSPMTIDDTKTTLFLGSDGKLKLAKAGSKMKGMRAYFKVRSASEAKPILVIGDDEEITAVDEIEVDPTVDTESAIYSVDGMYMGTNLDILPRGVYIVNGKKVIK